MNFKEWSAKYYPDEKKEILDKMSHAWASGHVNMVMSPDAKDLNNASALLEECVINGKKGCGNLYAWFLGEQGLIQTTIEGLNKE